MRQHESRRSPGADQTGDLPTRIKHLARQREHLFHPDPFHPLGIMQMIISPEPVDFAKDQT